LEEYIVQHWLIRRHRPDDQSLIQSQIQQAKARVFFALGGLLYLYLHAPLFAQALDWFLPLSAAYLLYNLAVIRLIQRKPLSALRTLAGPLFDFVVIACGMLLDGGHSSGIYFMMLIVIFGNAFRYGNALLIYAQVLAITCLIVTSIITLGLLQQSIDITLLLWQLLGLIVIPLYIYLVGDKAERALLGQGQAEQASMRLIEQGPQPVFTFDLDDHGTPRILYANEAIHMVSKQDKLALIGASPEQLCLAEDAPLFKQFCQQTLLQPQDSPRTLYLRGRSDNGEPLRLLCTATHIHWRDRNIGVCFIHDITERETQRERFESTHRQGYMSALVAGVVHDFRNVLTTIMGQAEVLHMEIENPELRAQIEDIIEAGERGATMITHLLTLAQSTAEVNPDIIDSAHRPSLERILGIARLQLPPHIRLAHHIDEILPRVAISLVEIEQILLNLINNAAAAIEHKGEIRIAIENRSDGLLLTVRDNGVGIPEKDLPMVTKPFWTSRGEQGGTGLGLAMVERIVRAHHGRLDIESTPGQGTCIRIFLPASKQAAPTQRTAPNTRTASGAQHQVPPEGYDILLIDDAPEVLAIHAALVGKLGHRTTTAENGKQALARIAQRDQPFDLIISDYRMPEMDGLELAIELRHRGIETPVLMITAYGEDERLRQAGRYGVTVLRKPISLQDLQAHILRAVKRQRDPVREIPDTPHR